MPFIGEYYLRGQELPPFRNTHFKEYWTASNGIFVRAQREEVHAIIPVIRMPIPIEGLYPIVPRVDLAFPPMNRALVVALLAESFAARDPATNALQEVLFHLRWRGEAWHCTRPEQEQTGVRVTPTAPYEMTLPPPIVDLHSHHLMEPFFSPTDTADDYGFRITAVWGWLDANPTILVRLGIYGHFYPLCARQVFDLPPFVRDGYEHSLPLARKGGWQR